MNGPIHVVLTPKAIMVRSPYEARELLKLAGLSWSPDLKVWYCERTRYAERVLRAYVDKWDGPVVWDDEAPSARKPGSWVEVMFRELPPHLRTPVYKALARALHPDHGGDNRLMQQVNDEYAYHQRKTG